MKLNELLAHRAVVRLATPVHGFWDGGAKSLFIFTPSVERTPGPPAIRWGSWGANLWLVVPLRGTVKQHFATLRRTLQGKLPRTITFERCESL